MEELHYRLKPIQLYSVLALSGCYFIMLIVLSHITHSLTILMASYHMFCNIIVLSGCILAIRYNINSSNLSTPNEPLDLKVKAKEKPLEIKNKLDCQKITNTYGWTRIDILTMVIYFIFLTSLSLSLFVESFETLAHQDHEDPVHFSIFILILPIFGFIVNGICFILIGGYTCQQKNFLYTKSVNEVVIHNNTKTDDDSIKKNNINETNVSNDTNNKKKFKWTICADLFELFLDMSSTVFVLICIVSVYISDNDYIIKLCDPLLSIFLCVLLVYMSYPKMKATCLILLQTIPQSIDLVSFEKQLIAKFPEIVSYHDLHIWQLTGDNYIATIHIKFKNPKLYNEIIHNVNSFFAEQNFKLITIQPEFQFSK